MSSESFAIQVRETVTGLVREMRPHQWYKQSVLLLGLIFSQNLFDPAAWGSVLLAAAAFTAVAGAAYIVNDISDVEEDRQHPRKQHRPIASGQVPIPLAAAFAVVLFVGGLVAALAVNVLVFAVLLAYLAQNVAYSLFLKDVILADVLVIAIGFVLRAVAGVWAIEVFLSPWLIVCTFLLALVLALGKRRHELESVSDPADSRASLGQYSCEEIDQLLVVSMAALLMAYALWTFFRGDLAMMLTLPFAVYGVFRYHYLVNNAALGGQPEYLMTDRPMMINAALWATTAIAALYDLESVLVGVIP